MFEYVLFFLREEVLQWIVALIVNYGLFYYHVKIKGYSHHYWLFNFFPTIFASASPDSVYAVTRVMELATGGNYNSSFWHALFANIFISWIFIIPIIGIVWGLSKLERFNKKPKDWVYYVIAVSLISMLIHLYIMDPLGF